MAMATARNRPPDRRHRRTVPTVDMDGLWCCTRPRAVSPRSAKSVEVYCKKNEDEPLKRSGEQKRASSEEFLKTGEIASLIKQGFIGEKVGVGSPFRHLRLSPGKVSPIMEPAAVYPSQIRVAADSGALESNAGALVVASPPPASLPDNIGKIKNSPTLLEMMVHEQQQPLSRHQSPSPGYQGSMVVVNKEISSLDRVNAMLISSPGNQFNDAKTADVKLTLSSKGGQSVIVNLHRHILVANSRFLAAKLTEKLSKQQRPGPQLVEISDCEEVETYVKTLKLMYCKDLKRALMKETVSNVLAVLKISAAIVFEAGIVSCLDHLEAVPWAEDEEEKVASVISQLQLNGVAATNVLTRVSSSDVDSTEDIISGLLESVIKGTDEKARREMKLLVSKMLNENVAQKDSLDVRKDTLYKACVGCLDALLDFFHQAKSVDVLNNGTEERGKLIAQISRQADNLQWLLDILIDRHMADDLLKTWAQQTELASIHAQVPTVFRYEVSRLTARLCVAIGKGQILAPKDVRFMLLQTWFLPLMNDFGWMHRCCKGIDKKVIEEGISQTILTLSLKQQQSILLGWFDRFSCSGDDCPNLQKAFEVWWRRMFVRPCIEGAVSSQVS